MTAGIIISFRETDNGERGKELEILLKRIHDICTYNGRKYKVYVIIQDDDRLFNKASLMNTGFDICKDEVDYVLFHDVDNIPMGNTDIYRNRDYTGNICQFIDGVKYEDKDDHFGDTIFFSKEDFININGFANTYWGWGFESSCTPQRLKNKGIKFKRGDAVIKTMKHDTAHRFNGNPNFANNLLIYRLVDIQSMEGYSDLKYKITKSEQVNDNLIRHYIKLPEYQYDVTKDLTKEDILRLGGEWNEKVYKDTLAEYKK
jgi:hypothetical protein